MALWRSLWGSLWVSLKDTFVVAPTSWLLWLLQFAGNIVLFLLFIAFLRTPEANLWQLVVQAVLAIAIVLGALVLHGGTLNYFAGAHEDRAAKVLAAFRSALKHVLALVVWALIVCFVWYLVHRLDAYSTSLPGYLRSNFPSGLRRAISEPALDNTYSFVVAVLLWVVLPGLTLPFALFAASRGFRGLIAAGGWWRMLKRLSYWIALVVAAIIGVYCTGKIMDWKLDPQTATLPAEKSSLFFRLLFAYVLAIFAWLLASSAVGRARADAGQTGSQPT